MSKGSGPNTIPKALGSKLLGVASLQDTKVESS